MSMANQGASDLEGWTIVFDLDGTLVETAPDLLAALNHTLSDALPRPVELDAIRNMIGQGARAMLERSMVTAGLVPDSQGLDARLQRFLRYYAANIAEHSRPFEDVETALAELRQRGARLAVCTNKTQALSESLLGALGLDKAFHAVVGADAVARRKPDAEHVQAAIRQAGGRAGRAVMIGDSLTDAHAARNAGIAFIFVPFGYESEPADAMGVDAVLDHFSTLGAMIGRFAS